MADWIIDDLQPLYVIWSLSFYRLIGKLDPAFIILNEKGIKKIIYNAYNFTLLILIEKINTEARSVLLITDM